jgi:hypothetical protein
VPDNSLERRRALRAQYRDLYIRASAILFRLDPIGINHETNTDEYDAEAELIVPCSADPRLKTS